MRKALCRAENLFLYRRIFLMKHGILSRLHKSLFRYQAWPTVIRDEDGVLYAGCSGFRLGHVCPMGKNLLYISRNDGETWSCPIVVADDMLDNRDVGLTYLGGKSMLLTSFCNAPDFYLSEGMRKHVDNHPSALRRNVSNGVLSVWESTPREESGYGSYVMRSDDGGETWTDKRIIPMTAPHGPIRLSDGRLLFLGKECQSHGLYEKGAILALESLDGGETWTHLCTLEPPEGLTNENLHEPHVLELSDGTLLGAIRGQGKGVPFDFSMYTCFSKDGGRTWTRPEGLGICGSPPHLMLHSSGAVILSYARRNSDTNGTRAMISRDGGKTFGPEIVLSPECPIWDLGYPATVELGDGSLYTVYYQRHGEDQYTSILYTKWTLDEVE